MVNAVPAGHVGPIGADFGGINAHPGVGVLAVNQLVGFFIIPQVEIAQNDHICFPPGAFQQPLGKDQFGRVRAVRVDIVDAEGAPARFDFGFGGADFILVAVAEDRARVLQRVSG